jgi:predicted nucleotidyltransferase
VDLANPITSVVPSLQGPVLSVLARAGTPLSQAEIHRLADAGSYSGVRKVLRRLVEHGIVDEVPGGFLLNRDHLAADGIVHLATLHGALAERLRGWATDHASVEFVGLFGSVARRDGNATSDIDVLVVADSSLDGRSSLRDDLTALPARWTGNDGHVQVLHRDDVRHLATEQAPIVRSWKRELQTVTGQLPLPSGAGDARAGNSRAPGTTPEAGSPTPVR